MDRLLSLQLFTDYFHLQAERNFSVVHRSCLTVTGIGCCVCVYCFTLGFLTGVVASALAFHAGGGGRLDCSSLVGGGALFHLAVETGTWLLPGAREGKAIRLTTSPSSQWRIYHCPGLVH